MHKSLLLVALTLFGCGYEQASSARFDASPNEVKYMTELMTNSIDSVYYLELLNSSDRWSCTAVQISESTIATAAHCLKNASKAYLYRNETFVGQVLELRDNTIVPIAERDMAIIKNVEFSIDTGYVEPLYGYVGRAGDIVGVVGYPLSQLNLGEQFSVGNISNADMGNIDSEWKFGFTSTNNVAPGFSGGPVFNHYGDLIGIAVADLYLEYGFRITVNLYFTEGDKI